MSDSSSGAVGYETSDAEPRLIGFLAIGIAVFLVLSPAVLWALLSGSIERPHALTAFEGIPAPVLQVDPNRDLAEMRRDEENRLTSYGWVDRAHGKVHIPIDRALGLTLQRGLPDWNRQ
jgi:hypothetical protein